MKKLEQIKAESKDRLKKLGFEDTIIESILDDYVCVKSDGIVLIKQRILGVETGKLTELYL